ncbi:MAG: hypothetical protein IM667_06750 [Phenylobacterium sp.]|nr:hypothetical protein [Phenylobacterium sp.]MCA6240320.1 hypothetical protein [Phenylobacterium sp.]
MSEKKPESTAQIDKIRALARQLEADEDETRFEEAVKKIAPKDRPVPRDGGNSHEP